MVISVSADVRFQLWFPYFRKTFTNISTTTCASTLQAYLADHLNFETPTCYRHMDCLLSNTRESTKAHLSASSIILGLAPTVMTTLGPSTPELSFLSTRRPLLSLLLAFASPAISFTTLFNPVNPTRYLQNGAEDWAVNGVAPRMALWLSVLQYIILLAAVANVVQNAYDLGIRTVMVWKCNVWFLPLLWSLLPGLTHVVVILVFNRSSMAKYLRNTPVAHRAGDGRTVASPNSNPRPSVAQRRIKGCRESYWCREFMLSANQYRPSRADTPPLESLAWVVLIVGSILGFLHTMVGTAIFSSLMFISVVDSFVVVLRFGISGAIGRAILVFELAGIKSVD